MQTHATRVNAERAERLDTRVDPGIAVKIGDKHVVGKVPAEGYIVEIHFVEPGVSGFGQADLVLHDGFLYKIK